MTAKLEDLKKLKVPELKSRLKKLGLDSKGLKAELIERLWSAVDCELESKLNCDTKSHSLIPTEEAQVYGAQSHREYADRGTQTDPGYCGATVGLEPSARGLGPLQKQNNEVSTVEEAGFVMGDVQEVGKGRAFYEFKEEIRYKRAKLPQPPVMEEHVEDPNRVQIDSYTSHLHFEVDPDGAGGHPRFWDRFPLLWAGCRLTHGVKQNKVGYEVKLDSLLTSQMQQEESFGFRVGWSVVNTSLLLGEDHLSFAYDGLGKKISYGKEEDYGEPLSVGDIVGCYASFSCDGAVELSFHKNGLSLGVAFSFDASVLQQQPLFPHVLCRNCSVRLNLDPTAGAWYPSPGFTSLIALPDQQKICAVATPWLKSHCEVIVMVGFPGSGKTHWAKNHIKQHPEKHCMLLSTEELLACIKTSVQRKTRLLQASQCLTELIKVAAKRPGNYILDQCNILFSARQYKLQLFAGFRRKVVVIFPSMVEWKKRLSKHQLKEGEYIPQTALLKLQVSCSLPNQDDLSEELQYMELSQQQADTLLQEYKIEARRQLPSAHKHDERKHFKKRPYPHRQKLSQKTRSTCQNGWGSLHSRTQQQPFWPASCLPAYYYNSCYYGC